MEEKRGAIVAGAIMIGLGIALAIMQFVDANAGGLVLVGLGAAFLVAWALTRIYGYLVPGCILFGLGAGLVLEGFGVLTTAAVVIGLGSGFVAIWVLDSVWSRTLPPHARWWPLVPGGILVLVGLGTGFPSFLLAMQLVWPAILVAVGAWFIWRGTRGSRRTGSPRT